MSDRRYRTPSDVDYWREAPTGAVPLHGSPAQFDNIIASDTATLTEMFKDGFQ